MIPQLLDSLFMHPVYGLKSPDLAETMSELAHSQRRSPKGQAAVDPAVEIKSFEMPRASNNVFVLVM